MNKIEGELGVESRATNRRNYGVGIEQSTPDQSMIDNLECSICLSLLDDPRNCLNGHNYCYKCITEWLKQNESCPKCKCELKGSTLGRNLFLQHYMSTLRVTCKYSFEYDETSKEWKSNKDNDDLCKEKILYPNLKKHEEACVYRFVDCKFNNDKCGQHRQKDIDNHYLVCQYRLVPCQACKSDIVFCELNEHMSTCDHVEIECDQCSILVEKRNYRKHIDDDCPETLINCTMGIDVCKDMIKRKDLNDHLQYSLVYHLVTKNQIYQDKIIELEKSNFNLTNTTTTKIAELEKTIAVLTKGIDNTKIAELEKTIVTLSQRVEHQSRTPLNIHWNFEIKRVYQEIQFLINGIIFHCGVFYLGKSNSSKKIKVYIKYQSSTAIRIDFELFMKMGWNGAYESRAFQINNDVEHDSIQFTQSVDVDTSIIIIDSIKINKIDHYCS